MIIVPKVSVIMGVYNCKNVDSLYKSVMSIIRQTFTDWEFIICNDGSTDNTLDTLKEIEKLDERIKIITYEKNNGLAYALNLCIKNAKGIYIARMDDDDISDVNRLEKQICFLDDNKNIDFVGSIANVFNEKGIWGILKMPEYPTKDDFLWNIPFIHPSMVFRKNAFEKITYYNTGFLNKRCEDYTLLMEMYSNGLKGHNIQETLIDYQVENGEKKYRVMKDRICESIVRYIGYKKNGILLKGIPYIIKPIILGVIPQIIFREIKKRQYGNLEK